MMKTFYTVLLIIISVSLFAQNTEMIVPFYNNGKWGFMNKNKDIIVCPQYEEAYPSYSDRYRVKKNGKYGYIDKIGKIVIKAKYDEASDFESGIAQVQRRGKTKYIRKDGKENKTFIGRCGNHPCLRARPSKSIEIIKQGNKYGIINNKLSNAIVVKKDTIIPMFDTIVPVTSQLMYVVKDSLFSFIHQGSFWSGADYVVQKLNFEYEDIKVFNCNLCSTGYNEVIGVKKNGLWGYVKIYDKDEKFIEPKYISINSLANGFSLVEYESEKIGYIDYSGNEYFIR